MTFTTFTFLLFMVVFFPLYWGLKNRTSQNLLIVISSYIFYGWWDWRFCLLMAVASLLDFTIGLALNKVDDPRGRKALLTVGLCGNLGMLGFFKYYNFFAENFRVMAESIGWHVDPATLRVVLPVGISFYTFQTMCYSIDIYRRKLKGTSNIIEYLAYVSFFPQLVAGPINRATDLLPQFFKTRVFNHDMAVDGARQMLWGFLKKMLVADNLAPAINTVYANPASFSGPELAVATIFFAFQIYFDFSAYSDIACGLARVLGFELMRNFAYPYFSQNMVEFWRRWHISLSTWFKDYVYFPLGGSRVGRVRRAFNVMTTFLISGLWHGASWNFLIWGGINGAALLPQTLSQREQRPLHPGDVPGETGGQPWWKVLAKIIVTFAIVCLGWVFFRARTFSDALLILRKIIHDSVVPHLYSCRQLRLSMDPLGPKLLIVLLVVAVAIEWVQRKHWHPLKLDRWPRMARWAFYTVAFWSILYLGTYQQGSFIYFQF